MLFQQTRKHWIEIPDVTAYTKMTVTLRAYSYWGYGPVTVSEIYSPMSGRYHLRKTDEIRLSKNDYKYIFTLQDGRIIATCLTKYCEN